MEKIVKKDGKVFLVRDFDVKGFETYEYLGLDPNTEKSKKKENKKEIDE